MTSTIDQQEFHVRCSVLASSYYKASNRNLSKWPVDQSISSFQIDTFSFDQSLDWQQRTLTEQQERTNVPEQMMRSADTPTTRELAQRLLAYEEAEANPAMADMHAVCLVCDKLRRPLTTLAGVAGFRSLLARALTLAKQESPVLGAWEVQADGSLQGLNGEAAQSGAVLIAHLIGLMITFIGQSLTLSMLHDVWLDLPDSDLKFEKDESK